MTLHVQLEDPTALADATGWVARHLPTHPSMPILTGALLEATDEALTVSGTDTETSIRVRVPATINNPGRVLVSGRLLAEITKLLPRHTMDLTADDTALTVTCGGSTVTLPLLSIDIYPGLPELPESCGEIDAGHLATEVARVASTTSRDESDPPASRVVAWQLPEGEQPLRLYGTDRFSLSTADLELHTGITGGPEPGWVLAHGRALETAVKALAADGAARIRLGITEGRFGLFTEHRQVVLARVEAPVLPYERLLSPEVTGEFTVPTRELAGAVKRLALHRDAHSAHVALDDNTLRITLDTTAGHGEETLPVDYTAAPVAFWFKVPRLVAAATAITTDLTHITIPAQASKPWTFREVDDHGEPQTGYRHVVMPAIDPAKQTATSKKAA